MIPTYLEKRVLTALGPEQGHPWLKRFSQTLTVLMARTMHERKALLDTQDIRLSDDAHITATHRCIVPVPVPTQGECTALIPPPHRDPPQLNWKCSPIVLQPLWDWLQSSQWVHSDCRRLDTPWYYVLLAFEAQTGGYWPDTHSNLDCTNPTSLTARARSFKVACKNLLFAAGINMSENRSLRGRQWGSPQTPGLRLFLWIPETPSLTAALKELREYNDTRLGQRLGHRHRALRHARQRTHWGFDVTISKHLPDITAAKA